jgi:hypothetical protein
MTQNERAVWGGEYQSNSGKRRLNPRLQLRVTSFYSFIRLPRRYNSILGTSALVSNKGLQNVRYFHRVEHCSQSLYCIFPSASTITCVGSCDSLASSTDPRLTIYPEKRTLKDDRGRSMVELRGDTRVRRFTHG